MKRSHVKNFVVYSTLFMLFGTNFYIWTPGIILQAFYVFIPVNLFLMLLMRRLWFPIQLLYVFAAISATCGIGLIQGTDTILAFAKQASGIMVTLFYFCSFFRMLNFDIEEAFRKYCQTAFYVVVWGLITFPFMAYFYGEPRLRSVLTEPSMFALTCLPALYYRIHVWQKYRQGGVKTLLFFLAFILAASSNGFLSMLFGVIVFSRRYKMGPLVAIPVVVLSAVLIYVVDSSFASRTDDTLLSLSTKDVRGTNLSSLALYSNYFVTVEVLRHHPFLGNGLGSHGLSYDRYAYDVSGVDALIDTPLERLNADDGSSLLLRTLSDTGILGAVAVLFTIWYFRPKKKDEISYMCEGILLYFFLKLLRGGQYFSNEQYFFVLIYLLRPMYNRLYPARATATVLVEAVAPNLQLATGV